MIDLSQRAGDTTLSPRPPQAFQAHRKVPVLPKEAEMPPHLLAWGGFFHVSSTLHPEMLSQHLTFSLQQHPRSPEHWCIIEQLQTTGSREKGDDRALTAAWAPNQALMKAGTPWGSPLSPQLRGTPPMGKDIPARPPHFKGKSCFIQVEKQVPQSPWQNVSIKE